MTKNFSFKLITIIAMSLVVGFGQVFAQSTVTGGDQPEQ